MPFTTNAMRRAGLVLRRNRPTIAEREARRVALRIIVDAQIQAKKAVADGNVAARKAFFDILAAGEAKQSG
jgi:hypothetical protein